MVTRADYRTALSHKLLAMEDGGYGDFDYDDTDLDAFLEIAVARLYPYVYRKVTEVKTLADYGTMQMSFVTPSFPERVFRIEDAVERTPVAGWKLSGTDIVNIDKYQGSQAPIATVNVSYHDAYVLPDDDVTDVGLSATFKPLVVLGAQIEALEARQDTGVRGDPPPIGQFQETQILDRLIPRYEKLRDGMAMGLPAVVL